MLALEEVILLFHFTALDVQMLMKDAIQTMLSQKEIAIILIVMI